MIPVAYRANVYASSELPRRRDTRSQLTSI